MTKTYFLHDIQAKEFTSKEPKPGVYVSYSDYAKLLNLYDNLKFTVDLYGKRDLLDRLKHFPPASTFKG